MYDLTPEEFDRLEAVRHDAPVTYARWVLNLAGIVSLAVALITLLSLLVMSTEGTPLPTWAYKAMSPVACCFTGFPGVLALLAAGKLFDGKKVGWYLGVLLGGLMVPSVCFPFGVLVLWALLRARARELFRA